MLCGNGTDEFANPGSREKKSNCPQPEGKHVREKMSDYRRCGRGVQGAGKSVATRSGEVDGAAVAGGEGKDECRKESRKKRIKNASRRPGEVGFGSANRKSSSFRGTKRKSLTQN